MQTPLARNRSLLPTGKSGPKTSLGGKSDPLVDLGSSGPSTLNPNPNDEVEVVGQEEALRAFNPVGSYVNQVLNSFSSDGPFDPARPGLPVQQDFETAPSNRDYEEAVQSLAPQTNDLSAMLPSASLSDLLVGVMEDSAQTFGTLQQSAGARGQATADSIGALASDIDAQMAQVGQDVGGDGAGGLQGSVLASGATAGSSGVREIQSALGGFLQQSQMRRTNAVQDYLSGLQGQSQIAVDRARSMSEFMQAQQNALIAAEHQRSQNDIAAATANDRYLQSLGIPPVPGLSAAEVLGMLPAERRGELLLGEEAGSSDPANVGPIGDEFRSAGVSEASIPGMVNLELAATNEFPEGFGSLEEAQQWLGQNTIVVSDGDKRQGKMVKQGNADGMSQKLAVTQSDLNRYLQWIAS